MRLLARLRKALPRPRITIARWIALTTLTAMFILLLLKGLFSLLLSVWAQPPLLESGVIEKVATVTRILDAAPEAQRANIASAAGDGSYSVQWLRSHDEAGMPELVDAEFRKGTPTLRALLKRPDARIEAFEPSDLLEYEPARGYALMIELSDRSWVLYRATDRSWGLDELPRNLIILTLMLLSSLVVALFATRYLAHPLERFAEGARRFGKDFNAPPIPVVGPHDLRQAILAFNATQAQLKHFLNDRTQMLAAISHDLRAPLTRMRLRGEFIEDGELQAKLFKDVDEMQAMVDAALEFFRDDARLEQTTAFDLAEMLQTVVDDFKDAGIKVALDTPRRCVYVGRPVGIKRVLVNLVDNAVKYGLAPELRLAVTAEQLEITVLDRGPGIAPELQERVFAPFFRIEGSRNRDTGGVGLGLPAVRAIVLEQGGSVTLANRPGGGLEVKVSLPVG
ncbi:ATP-binding protein [Pseudomonas sp. CC120222-01a]|uniref:ATP-binding protein n=1 Tax=Pseudomonas sp. CC120222-01a TaxID=1378075 RepID=UPI000D87DF00|nr:ATP-binding protein [Pseudomonas sp. CC120222-01a]PVZ43690.1 signal transduction histidine kinase [Pseudomonas sp. CC120222-01a]